MTQGELHAYCFGFFDGEGCISISPNGAKSHRVQIVAGQKIKHPLELLQTVFGGKINLTYRRGIPVLYVWALSKNSEKIAFLELGTAYLIGKKQEAELALNLLRAITKLKAGRWNPLSEEFKTHQLSICEIARNLKRQKCLMTDKRGQYELPVTLGFVSDRSKRGSFP